MDRTINKLPTESICELKYQTPVTVTDYHRALLTKDAWETLRQSVPANCRKLTAASANMTFEDAFKDGYFYFSHYGQANDISPMQSIHAWAYWLRGTAIACPLNQELTDRMTPIYFPKLGKVSPDTISVNLNLDKTSDSVNPATIAIQSAESLSIFSGVKKLPYIAAVHCYALTEDEGIAVSKPSSQSKKVRTPNENTAAPRYQIDFRGLGAYASITDDDKSIVRRMISRSKKGVFETHSREYGIPALQRMLPVLASDGASAEWCADQEQALSRPAKRMRSASHGATTLASSSTLAATVIRLSDGRAGGEKQK